MKIFDPDINALNLECISYKACRDEEWTLEQVDRIEKEYRAFLQVIRNLNKLHSVAPTLEIDKYWHHHILDTVKYHEDCDSLFGYYVQHFPYSGIFGEIDSKKQSELVINTFSLIKEYLS